MPLFEATGTSDPFDLWASAGQMPSFGLEDEAPVYRLNLPALTAEALNGLSAAETDLAQMGARLGELPQEFEALANRELNRRQSGLSFASPGEATETTEALQLLELLAEADGAAPGSGEVSFGIGETASEAFGAARLKLEAFQAQMEREIGQWARVETSIAHQKLAETRLSWGGDVQTVFSAALSLPQATLHQRALRLAAQTRAAKMRLLVTVLGGAAKLAALTAAGAPILALPAAYRYATNVIKQAKNLQELSK